MNHPYSEPKVDLDSKIAQERAKHSCLRRLDEFMFCMTPTSQFGHYYSFGTYADCPVLLQRWQTCLKSRISKPHEAKAMLHEEREKATTGTHVFLFRPEYAREAYERYGIPIEPQHGGMQEQ